MRIYRDLISGDELFSDAYGEPKPVEDGNMLVIESKLTTEKRGEINEALLGANPSAEEANENMETASESGLDFVLCNRLKEMPISSKKELQAYFKDYFQTLVAKLNETSPDKVEEVKNMAKRIVPKWVAKWKDLSYYVGESGQFDSLAALVEWNDDGVSAKAYFFRCGLIEEKV